MSIFSFFKRFLGATRTEEKLKSDEARRLVDLVGQAQTVDAAVASAETAFSFLVAQLHILGDSANGYPKNPINAQVWTEGLNLANTCDRFADAVARWDQRRSEEQATRLAATMALQIMAHYPEEVFPRVVRNAMCCEGLAMIVEAIDGYTSVVDDFDHLQLEEILDSSGPFNDSEAKILTAVHNAFAGLQRLSPHRISPAQRENFNRLNAALARRSTG
jgi:hypothetical protein